MKALAERLKSVSPSRLRVISETLNPASSPPTAKVLVSFTYRDHEGKEKEAKAKVYLPESILAAGKRQAPAVLRRGIRAAGRGRARLHEARVDRRLAPRARDQPLDTHHEPGRRTLAPGSHAPLGGRRPRGDRWRQCRRLDDALAGRRDVPSGRRRSRRSTGQLGLQRRLFLQTARQGRASGRQCRQGARALWCGNAAQALPGCLRRELRRLDLVRRLTRRPGAHHHVSGLGLLLDGRRTRAHQPGRSQMGPAVREVAVSRRLHHGPRDS